jgi:hypothetical protein
MPNKKDDSVDIDSVFAKLKSMKGLDEEAAN